MPRRRTTRNKSKRPGPTMPGGDEGANIDMECKQEKVKTLIEDFENEVKSKLRDLDVMKPNMISQIDLAYTMELMQIPAEVRSMKLTDFLNKGGSFEAKQSASCSEVDSIVSSVVNVNSNKSANQLEALKKMKMYRAQLQEQDDHGVKRPRHHQRCEEGGLVSRPETPARCRHQQTELDQHRH